MLHALLITCMIAAARESASSQPTTRPTEWGELSRWLRVAAALSDNRPVAGQPLGLTLWGESFGKTARLLPSEVTGFCILRTAEGKYFSEKLRPADPLTLEGGEAARVLTADLSKSAFYAVDGKLKLKGGYPTPAAGQPQPESAGTGRKLLKPGRFALQAFVHVAKASNRPEDLARSPIVRFEVAAPEPVNLTPEQKKTYDELAPKFRRGVVSASKAGPEAVQIGARAVPTLRILIGPDEPHYARAWASDALAKIVAPSAASVIREMIRKPVLGDRNVIAYHLMRRRDREAKQLIVELLQASKGPVPRLWIARGFVDFRRKFEGKAAQLLLTDRDPKVLYLCGMALRRGATETSDTQRVFDMQGNEGLAQRAAVALVDGLSQADKGLQPHILSALTRLTGLEHESTERWKAWRNRHADKPE